MEGKDLQAGRQDPPLPSPNNPTIHFSASSLAVHLCGAIGFSVPFTHSEAAHGSFSSPAALTFWNLELKLFFFGRFYTRASSTDGSLIGGMGRQLVLDPRITPSLEILRSGRCVKTKDTYYYSLFGFCPTNDLSGFSFVLYLWENSFTGFFFFFSPLLQKNHCIFSVDCSTNSELLPASYGI